MAQSDKGSMDSVRREGNGRRGRGFRSRRLSSLVVLALVVVLMVGMVQHTINFVHGFHSMGRTTVVDVRLEGMHGYNVIPAAGIDLQVRC